MVLAGGAAAVLTAVLIVSAYGDAPPPLAEETGDVQARAESGEELSGVRPYTLETEDGDEEYVYVLQLEGKPGFKQARKRWGFHANPMSHPPFVHPQEIDVLERAGGLEHSQTNKTNKHKTNKGNREAAETDDGLSIGKPGYRVL